MGPLSLPHPSVPLCASPVPLRARRWPPDTFAVGVNLPWVTYGCDFGASAWFPHGGLAARPDALETYEGALDRFARDQQSIVRLFLLCDCRSGVCFDEDGLPAGLDESFLRDADAALDRAADRGLVIMPVLVDFHLCAAPCDVSGVRLGGHSRVLTDASARDAFLSLVVRPIVERYADHPAVAAWDLFNEPEWCMREVSFEDVRETLDALAGVVRSCAPQPMTVGSASAGGLDLVRGVGLDFYQVHWYTRFGWAALAAPVTRFGLDRPVILGEFPGRAVGTTPAEIVAAARDAGYSAALIWSLLSDDRASAYEPVPSA